MRKNLLLLFCMAGMAVSCTNDCLPMFDDGCNWQTSLSEIADDNKELFTGRGMEITGACQMKDMKLDRELLCGGEYGSFPVYSEKDSVFTVLTYDELCKDAEKYNYDMEKVDARIDSILSHADDYDIIQLEWTGRAGKFYTLALFNRLTAELEYDNMLYNMSTVARYDSQELSMMVSGFEFGVYLMTKGDVITYKVGDLTMATAGLVWHIYGTRDNLIYLGEDNYYIRYRRPDTFTFSYLDYTIVSDHFPGYDTFINYRCFTPSGVRKYSLVYAIWTGPKDSLVLNNFNVHLTSNDEFQGMIKAGEGRLVQINDDAHLGDEGEEIIPKYNLY